MGAVSVPVDVLAVLGSLNLADPDQRPALNEARSAVSELIDAIRAFRSDQSTAALQRLSAAQARVGGASEQEGV